MFQLISSNIDVPSIQQQLSSPQAGALNCFEGRVRDHHQGRKVVALEYEAYRELCEFEALKILAEAKQQFGVIQAVCLHRVGRLNVGDMAVWIGVIAAHRDESFKACRYIIDEIKKRLPIWKKEFYADGDSGWVNCECARTERVNQPEYYSRQLTLADIGPAGQQKLFDAKVLVVGAGGLGSAALLSLASAGVGTVGICDHDILQESNLHRQHLYAHDDIGQAKAQLAAERIGKLNPSIHVHVHRDRLDVSNAENLIKKYDVILDGTDDLPTKFLLNDVCYLQQKPLVQASIYQFDGQLHTLLPSGSGGCLRCQWPEMPDPSCVGTCQDAGVLSPLPAVFGQLQALEAIKIICGFGEILKDNMLVMNLRDYQ